MIGKKDLSMIGKKDLGSVLNHAVYRAQWSALGLKGDDLNRPKIAIVNSSSGISICYSRLDEVVEHVAAGVRSAGGVPLEIRTCAPSDGLFFANGKGALLAAARDAIVRDVEIMVEGAQLDGIVFLSSCDSTTPAHLAAAAKINKPALIVACGYQTGPVDAAGSGDVSSVYEAIGKIAIGTMRVEELDAMAHAAIRCPGVCPGIGTATSMHMAAEALGLALAGSTPTCGGGAALLRHAESAGARSVQLVHERVTARSILTVQAFENAIAVMAAVGGAASVLFHLGNVASAAGLVFDPLNTLKQVGAKVGLLTSVAPNGSGTAADLEHAGGARGVMRQITSVLHLDVPTVSGTTLRHVLQAAPVPDEIVIRPMTSPVDTKPGLQVLQGELAPSGGVVRPGGVKPHQRRFSGPVKHLGQAMDAFGALSRGEVKRGQVLILKNGVDDFACALAGAELIEHVAVLTNGGYSGLGRGLVVGYLDADILDKLTHEDFVQIDLDRGTINRIAPEAITRTSRV